MYDGDGLLSGNSDAEGWGHLSWRGAVPFFVSWRKAGISEGQLLDMIENLSKVPDINISESTEKAPLSTEVTVNKLLSPEAMVKFYLHLEEIKQKQPNEKIVFTSGNTDLSYQAVINQLEQGVYIPMGETDEAIRHLNGIIDSKSHGASQYSTHITRTKHIVWDHEHFRNPLPIAE